MSSPPTTGTTRTIHGVVSGEVEKYEMRFGAARRLTDFKERYCFFTPALLYLCSDLGERPWVEFAGEHGDVIYAHHRFRQPIFQGMTYQGDPGWNHVLWCVEQRHWETLEPYLLSLAQVDPAKARVTRIGVQDLEVVDPLYLQHHLLDPQAPLLTVRVLGVNASDRCVAVDPPADSRRGLPVVRWHPPQEPVVRFARTLFSTQDRVRAVSTLDEESGDEDRDRA